MDPSLQGLWVRAVATALLLQVVADTRVARGEFVHKNLTSTTPSPSSPTDTAQDGEVRCHCNLPRCVTQGYMCKSMLGACFTRNTPAPTPHAYSHRARTLYHRWAPMHGCLELLQEDRRGECLEKAGAPKKRSSEGDPASPSVTPPDPDPDLTCCREDMCNYRDLDVYIKVDGGSYHTQTDLKKERDGDVGRVWFRAATIAVPITGGVILILLAMLAGRMLAKEKKRQRMAQQVVGERYLKSPLYPVVSATPHPLHHHHHHICYHPHHTSSKSSPTSSPHHSSPQHSSSHHSSPHHSSPLLSTPSSPHHHYQEGLRVGYRDNPSLYHPHETSPEELRPLNVDRGVREEYHGHRELDSMLPT